MLFRGDNAMGPSTALVAIISCNYTSQRWPPRKRCRCRAPRLCWRRRRRRRR
eukprot:SAG22_NODE_1513_length_4254_cov_10.073887_1_plen_51_part_10